MTGVSKPAPAAGSGALDAAARGALHAARAAEKAQCRHYRALAAAAEAAGDAALSERLNALHADEQHHLSRLTARLLELGEAVAAVEDGPAGGVGLDGWEPVARERERREVAQYEALLSRSLDDATRALVAEILETERHHAADLDGKWTPA
jgi:rubrerythrin